MNKYFLFLLLPLMVLMTGCGSDDDQPVPNTCTVEFPTIEEFMNSDTLSYTELDSSGMFYYIADSGSVEKPTLASSVTANYSGYFTDGTIFDQTTPSRGPATFPLQQVIEGWQLGLPLVGQGGLIRLVIPYELAYGAGGQRDREGNYVICPATDMVFDIQLISFTN